MLKCTIDFFSSGFAESIDAPVSNEDFPDTARDILLPQFNFYDYFTTANDDLPEGMQHGGTNDAAIEDSFFGELMYPRSYAAQWETFIFSSFGINILGLFLAALENESRKLF